jgi:hypothetical protein
MADNCDQFALAACLDPQNAETVLLVVEVTRSTRPASTSRSDGLGSIFMNPVTGGGCPISKH